MPKATTPNMQRKLASPSLSDAFTDFMLSREAMNCTKNTVDFYWFTAYKFLRWCEKSEAITDPNEITARHVRQYLSNLKAEGKSDRTLNAHGRAVRTVLRFFHREAYLDHLVTFEIPKIAKKRLPILNEEQLKTVLKACDIRERAIVMFMADSGLRRQEIINLNWGDVDMDTGLVRIVQGKGRKDRASVIGATTRRALLAYKRTVDHNQDKPLFQTRSKGRFETGTGLLIVFRRISERTGIHVTPHALRRTFVILALRADMDAGHLQAMLGHTSLDMVYYYAQMVDADLVREHKLHSPMDKMT